jgi:hypothetical protein
VTTSTPSPLLATAERLADTLERLGDGLVALDLAALLGTEETLADLLSAMRLNEPWAAGERDALKVAVMRAQRALLRCRRLGASFGAVARARLPRIVAANTYTRGGYSDGSTPASIEATI